MKAKKIFFSLFAASCSFSSCYAQSFDVGPVTFTPTARLVGGIEYVNNAYKAGVAGDRTRIASNQWGTSYFGIGMLVPLTEGFSGVGSLESGFGTDTGETNDLDGTNTLFNRKANVGIQHDVLGQLTVGTHLFIAQDIEDMDPMGFQSIGLNTLVNGANDGAAQKSVLYRTADIYGFNAGYMHQFGGEVGDAKRSSSDGFSFSYAYGDAKIRAIYQKRADNYGRYTGGNFYGLGTQGRWLYVKNTAIAGSYNFNPVKIFVGYERVEAPDSGHGLSYTFDDKATMSWIGANYSATEKLTVLAAAYQVKQSHSNKKSNLYAAGVNYAFNDYFTVFSTVGYITNNSIAANLVSEVGANNHALSYDDVSCKNESDCNGASQLGGYTGLAFKF